MLEDFINENLIKTHDFVSIPAKVVYERYRFTQGKKGLKILGKRKFYSEIEEYGLEKKRGLYRGWYIKACKY